MAALSAWLRRWILDGNIWFLIFLTLVLIKPATGPNINRYLGILAWLVVFGVFLAKLAVAGHRPGFWLGRYKIPLIFIGGLFAAYGVSALVHLASYPNLSTFVFRALSPLAVMSLFPMLWSILETRQAVTRMAVLGSLFVIEALGAVQPFHPEWVNELRRHTVAADALYQVTSLYRWHTILGTLSALIALYGMVRLLHARSGPAARTGYGLLTLVSLTGGALSRSRNFLFALLVGLVAWLFSSRQRIWAGLGVLIFCLGLFHAVAWLNPKVAGRYATALPYLKKLHTPSAITGADFVPRINNHSLSNRARIWSKAVEMWRGAPWLGVGPGVFNLKSGLGQRYNTHNAFLQVLVDAGAIGMLCFVGFWLYLCGKTFGRPAFPLVIGIMGALSFDNFLDYSMAWVLATTWLAYDIFRLSES
ncbi:MAG: O-antigen ligase family protein [Methylothermaceae bacterium]|nr:O-antigen ligase family protein [Methylothermaceae bacterium]